MKDVKIFTLSSYDNCRQTVSGRPPKNPSFKESLSPLEAMIKSFTEYPTGTKIKVTMETLEMEEEEE